jgi:hypothetical protein
MYQSYGVNNRVTKLLNVHWHGWYVHIIFHESPKVPWVSDWVIWVAMECSRHDLSIFPRMFGSGTAVKQRTGCDSDSVEGSTYEIVFPAYLPRDSRQDC